MGIFFLAFFNQEELYAIEKHYEKYNIVYCSDSVDAILKLFLIKEQKEHICTPQTASFFSYFKNTIPLDKRSENIHYSFFLRINLVSISKWLDIFIDYYNSKLIFKTSSY